MQKKFFIFIGLVISYTFVFSQFKVAPYYYAIYFKDKKNNQYSIDKPQEFLSQKAILRREKNNIAITEQDLPVSQQYLDSLKNLGLKIVKVSKWLNCAIVYAEPQDTLKIFPKVRKFDFVSHKKYTQGKKQYVGKTRYEVDIKNFKKELKSYKDTLNFDFYGGTLFQNKIIKIGNVHSLGYMGQGITMAVFDAGFWNVDTLSVFKQAFEEGRIIPVYDFVDMDSTLFNVGTHGTEVLATILGYIPGKYIGTAPKATVYLFRTEDGDSEYPIEEYNYVIACEKADSIGVDLIHASLGYSDFDDDALDYSYDDMNGNRAVSTIGADIAASKGIVVISSAGNEGDSEWHYITAPADADSCIAVGAVSLTGRLVSFSSRGPSFDGRIKPDVAAPGSFVVVQSPFGDFLPVSGTSFSGPITAGAVASVFSAYPDAPAYVITEVVRASGEISFVPDDDYGFGIFNSLKAYVILKHLNEDPNKYNSLNLYVKKYNEAQLWNLVQNEKSVDAANLYVKYFSPQGKYLNEVKEFLEKQKKN